MAGEDAGLHEFHPDSLIVSKDNTQQRLIGTNIFHWEHYWEGFVGYSITMDKRFLNYICCNPFIQLELYNVEHLSSHPASFLHSPVQCVCPFPGGNNVLARLSTHTSMQNIILCVGRSIGS